jgi:hypothetical protein
MSDGRREGAEEDYERKLLAILRHLRAAGEDAEELVGLDPGGYSLECEGEDNWPELREAVRHLRWHLGLLHDAIEGLCPMRLRRKSRAG